MEPNINDVTNQTSQAPNSQSTSAPEDKTNKSRIMLLIIIGIIIIVLIIGGIAGGYLYGKNSTNNEKAQNTVISQKQNSNNVQDSNDINTSDWKAVEEEDEEQLKLYGFKMKYPPDWRILIAGNRNITADITLQEYIDGVETDQKEYNPDAGPISNQFKKIYIDNREIITKDNYNAVLGGVLVAYMRAKDDYVVTIQGFPPGWDGPDYSFSEEEKVIFEKILSTIKFVDN